MGDTPPHGKAKVCHRLDLRHVPSYIRRDAQGHTHTYTGRHGSADGEGTCPNMYDVPDRHHVRGARGERINKVAKCLPQIAAAQRIRQVAKVKNKVGLVHLSHVPHPSPKAVRKAQVHGHTVAHASERAQWLTSRNTWSATMGPPGVDWPMSPYAMKRIGYTCPARRRPRVRWPRMCELRPLLLHTYALSHTYVHARVDMVPKHRGGPEGPPGHSICTKVTRTHTCIHRPTMAPKHRVSLSICLPRWSRPAAWP
jgi:hypothetical protein